MIAWWIAQLALLGALLAVAAYGAEAALKVARRQTRWVWVAAMGMTLALGAVAPTRSTSSTSPSRDWQVTTTTNGGATIVSTRDGFAASMQAGWHDLTARTSAQVQRAWSVWHDVMPNGTERWLLIAWAIASAALLIAFVAVHLRYQRRRTQWPLGDVQGTTVRIAKDTGPAVIGVTSAEIVLPQWLLGRDDREQRLVLEHELEHVRQHDPLLLTIAQAAVILLPWNPAMWWMASRLRLAVELDCDRRVLRRGASARDYGTLLIDLTDHRTGFGAALPAFSCSPSNLERRLVAMTPKRLKYPLVRALTTGAFASLALLAACEAKLPTSDEVDAMTARTAVKAVSATGMIDTAKVTYFINDVAVSKAEADKVAAERIATVNVTQKGAEGGGEVRLVLRNLTVLDSTPPTRVTLVRTDPTQVTLATPGDTVMLSPASGTMKRMSTQRDTALLRLKPSGESKQRTGFTGLMIVDGVITDPAIANSIAPDQIVAVDVMKGASATSAYSDPRAVNGVIKITTKKAKP